MVDWSKPIQFENGEPCELIDTYSEGYLLFPGCTRCVGYPGVKPNEASFWFFPEDGKCRPGNEKDGYSVINQANTTRDSGVEVNE